MKGVRVSRKQRRDVSERVRAVARVGIPVAAGAILVALALVVVAGFGVRASIGCTTCHESYATAHAQTVHATVACAVCHAREGALGVLPDGVRAVHWAGSAVLGKEPAASLTAGQAACDTCHDSIGEQTIDNRGIAVRHADFVASTACSFCHGGTGHQVEGRAYRTTHMDDCMTCHTTALSDMGGCSLCHLEGGEDERAQTDTAWRVTHGPQWRQTHGMGDQSTCRSCHTVDFCVKCHGVRVPHPADWPAVHGRGLDAVGREGCATCHEPEWCTSCHGIEMPHPQGFLPAHGPESDRLGEETCERCHDPAGCDVCHFESSHPNLPIAGSHGS